MSEYVLKITCDAQGDAKRLNAPNDSAAILAAIQWEDHNTDMVLSSEGRVVARKDDGLWVLQPGAACHRGPSRTRAAIDDFTINVGWAKA